MNGEREFLLQSIKEEIQQYQACANSFLKECMLCANREALPETIKRDFNLVTTKIKETDSALKTILFYCKNSK